MSAQVCISVVYLHATLIYVHTSVCKCSICLRKYMSPQVCPTLIYVHPSVSKCSMSLQVCATVLYVDATVCKCGICSCKSV